MKEKDTLALEMLHHNKIVIIILSIIIFILILALVISNLAWLIYESQWEEVETTTLSGESATYLENSESGDINYGNYTQSN